MEQSKLLDCIDVKLVKEQLRLLGHDVTDDVIMSFVKGLAGGAEQQSADGRTAVAETGQDVHHKVAGWTAKRQQQHAGASSSWHHSMGRSSLSSVQAGDYLALPTDQELRDAIPAVGRTTTTALLQRPLTDVPCKSQQADQRSPQRAVQEFGSPAAAPGASLDQRCRKFLARLADRQSTQQQQQQQLVSSGTRSTANVAELSDSALEDHDQAACSPPTRHQHYKAMHSTAGVPNRGSSSHASTADAHSASDLQQHLAGGIQALQIAGSSATQCQQPNSGDDNSSSQQPQQPGYSHCLLDAGSDVVYEVPGVGNSDSLPRFGFRSSYKPAGIHLPPPPGQAALALIQQTIGGRNSRAADTTAVTTRGFAGDAGAASAPLEGSSCACSWRAGGQQQQPQQQLVAKVQHRVAAARAAPGLRASSDSIICDAIPGGGSSCCDARPRHVSRDNSGPSDPLYHAPTSPSGGVSSSCSSRALGSGRSPAANPTGPPAAGGSSRPRSLAVQHAAAASHSAGSEHHALLSRKSSYSRTSTTSSRNGVAPSLAGGSSYGGTSNGSSNSSGGSSLSRYSQQLTWGIGRSNAMAPGVRKTDRVARFQKMQQAWQNDRYLSTGGARRGTAASSRGTGRPAAAVPVCSKPNWED